MENFEMPTPCSKCGETFDLNDGRCSEKWFPNTTICEPCWEKEAEEIEEDERWETINAEVGDALFDIKDEGAWAKLTDENRALIIDIVMGQSEQLINFLIHLNDTGLINNHDFDYEKEAKKYIKKIINCP